MYFYKFKNPNGDKRQESFDDLMDAIKFCIKHYDNSPWIKDPVVTDAGGTPKFAPRTIK